MSLLIPDAWAAPPASPSAPAESLWSFVPLVVIFVIFYFLLIRPQTKRAKEHRTMLEALAKGDEVVLTGGLVGRITELGEPFMTVELAKGVTVQAQRQAVQTVLPKGTLKL